MRVVRLAAGILITAVLSARAAHGEDPQRLQVAAILPLTGSNATHGEYVRRGLEMALEDAKAAALLRLRYADNRSQTADTISAYKQLLAGGKPHVVITLGSPMAMALAPLANQDRILLFSMAHGPAYSTPDDYTFRVISSAKEETAAAVEAITVLLKSRRAAVFYVNHDYGESARGEFEKQFRGEGEIVAQESFNPGETDFRTQILRLKGKSPDVIFVAAWGLDTALLIKQAKDYGLNSRFLCTQACQMPDVLRIGGPAAEGLLVVAPSDAAPDAFRTRYRKSYGEEPTFVTLHMYDTLRLIGALAERCRDAGYSASCLLQEMPALRDFPGVSFPINFDRNGDMNDRVELKTVRGGKFVPYQ